MSKIDYYAKRMAVAVIQGYGETEKDKTTQFVQITTKSVEQALKTICLDISDDTQRTLMQRRVYESAKYGVKYENMGLIPCEKNKFYNYRRDFIRKVAENLGISKE